MKGKKSRKPERSRIQSLEGTKEPSVTTILNLSSSTTLEYG